MKSSSKEVTRLLLEWNAGNQDALINLIPLVYDELHRLARRYLRRERSSHTLQATALVNEAYLHLIDQDVQWQNRAHFFGIAAQLMRRILVGYARSQAAFKRGGGKTKLSLDETITFPKKRDIELIALDDALVSLDSIDKRQSQIVELKFFGGLTTEEVAEILKISPATVKREWTVAKAWLYKAINEGKL
ncbi:MAG: sigma-70 family RNA polymerase sigma factor [Acidobacteriota bacterium]